MKKVLLILLISFLLLPKIVFADGGLLPPDNHHIFETRQEAAIVFDEGKETLVLTTGFEGDTKDFSWIIPTPSIPEVSKISSDFFENLEEMTVEDTGYSRDYMAAGSYGLGAAESAVEVIEQKQIGYYDVAVLKSTDENALYNWLKENGYSYPEEGKFVLDDYISRKWIFTAIKIKDEALSDEDIQSNLHYGDISPIKFVFQTDKIVYPMYISSISKYYTEQTEYDYYNGMGVTLYVFADQKTTYSGFSTQYANWINKNEIEKLATDDEGNAWVNTDKKLYLTKLYRYFDYAQMQEDLYLKNALDNDKVGVSPWYANFYSWVIKNIYIVAILLMLGFFVPMFWQFKKVSKKCRIISWIIQIISFIVLVLPVIALLIIILNLQGVYFLLQSKESIILILYLKLLVTAMLAILIIQKFIQKKYLK